MPRVCGTRARAAGFGPVVRSAAAERGVWTDSNRGPHWITAAVMAFVAASPVAFWEAGHASALAVAFYVLATSTVVNLWVCRLADPGALAPSEQDDPVIAAAMQGECVLPQKDFGFTKDYSGQWCRAPAALGSVDRPTYSKGVAHQRYCQTCRIWRPDGASHCSRCGYCFRRFDHHCGVIGTCVARDNHRFFASFLMSGAVGALTVAAGCVNNMVVRAWPRDKGGWDTIGCLSLVLCGLSAYTGFLLFFACAHCYFTLCGSTTAEALKADARSRGRACLGTLPLPQRLSSAAHVWCAPCRLKAFVPLPPPSPAPVFRAPPPRPAGVSSAHV